VPLHSEENLCERRMKMRASG